VIFAALCPVGKPRALLSDVASRNAACSIETIRSFRDETSGKLTTSSRKVVALSVRTRPRESQTGFTAAAPSIKPFIVNRYGGFEIRQTTTYDHPDQ
jgi:hypothetical protein